MEEEEKEKESSLFSRHTELWQRIYDEGEIKNTTSTVFYGTVVKVADSNTGIELGVCYSEVRHEFLLLDINSGVAFCSFTLKKQYELLIKYMTT